MFLNIVYRQSYNKVRDYMANKHAMKMETYPKTLTDAYEFLQNYHPSRKVGQAYVNEGPVFEQQVRESDMSKVK